MKIELNIITIDQSIMFIESSNNYFDFNRIVENNRIILIS